MKAGAIKRPPGAQIDRAGNRAFDHVGSDILEHLDLAQQFGRDIIEAEFAPAGGGKNVAAVQFGTHERQAANDHSGAFDRKSVGIGCLFEPPDIDAWHALQRLGHRTIGQCPDILCSDRIDKGVGVAFDVLG